jgi:choline-sulfatase
MVRQGNWKLNYYVGFEPQLFNLEDDPTEMNDLSRSPEHTAVKEELLALVLDGWDPEAIKAGIDSKSADIDLLKEWGANIQPTDSHRWDLRPEMDHVDGG